jgi:hypothetical protein
MLMAVGEVAANGVGLEKNGGGAGVVGIRCGKWGKSAGDVASNTSGVALNEEGNEGEDVNGVGVVEKAANAGVAAEEKARKGAEAVEMAEKGGGVGEKAVNGGEVVERRGKGVVEKAVKGVVEKAVNGVGAAEKAGKGGGVVVRNGAAVEATAVGCRRLKKLLAATGSLKGFELPVSNNLQNMKQYSH